MTNTALRIAALALTASFALTGCSVVSAEQEKSCAAAGGTVVSEEFTSGEGENADRSGGFDYCKLADGTVGDVYDAPITTAGWPKPDDKVKLFTDCTAVGGKVYQSRHSSKARKQRWVCVSDGHVINVA